MTPTGTRRRGSQLAWEAFHGRFFPTSRLHDFTALLAYDAYRRDSTMTEPSSDDVLVWESEGGRGEASPPVAREAAT
jgi:hypothetical protein